MTKGFTIWFTGLSGSGKSTLANLLHSALQREGIASIVLDGDQIRQHLTKGLGFSREDRVENLRRIAFVAKLLTQVGGTPITATISPYESIRKEIQQNIESCFLIYVKCPFEVCAKRDPKGLYEKAQRGEIKNFTGLSDPFEEPPHPHVTLLTDQYSPEECLHLILDKLRENKLIPPWKETVPTPT